MLNLGHSCITATIFHFRASEREEKMAPIFI